VLWFEFTGIYREEIHRLLWVLESTNRVDFARELLVSEEQLGDQEAGLSING
jgi:hypothetical protein